MKIQILGSGGFITTPKPSCQCEVCNEARNKPELARTGPSYYLPDLDVLIDTPAEIKDQLDKLNKLPNTIVYSHWHPDHTEGYRVFEYYPSVPKIYNQTGSKILDRVQGLNFLKSVNKVNIIDWPADKPIQKNQYQIAWKVLNEGIPVYFFLISDGQKNILLCPDHAKYLLDIDLSIKIDLLIMNLGEPIPGNGDVTTLDDNIRIVEKLKPSKTVLTHIEEHFGLTSSSIAKMKSGIDGKNILIGSDSMTIEV